jgi:hypothetical protein
MGSQKQVGRTANGQFRPGVSGNASGNVHRSRHSLNADTIREMHAAFREGGREAILKVMRTQPAAFLKLLVLLVPREMKVEHSGGVKAMSDEQLEAGIEAIQAMLEQRADIPAKVIEGTAETVALPVPDVVPNDQPKRPNKVMDAADTTVGPKELDPRKRNTKLVPPPSLL